MATEEEKAVEIKGLMAIEKAPAILTAGPTTTEKAVTIETQAITPSIEAPKEYPVPIMAQAAFRGITKERNKISQEISTVS